MTIFSLNDFLNDNPSLHPLIVKTEGETSKWGRVICKWHEKEINYEHEHIFTPLINLQTGEMYADCSKKKIYAKFIAHTIGRPIHIALKILYHLAIPISIPHIAANIIIKGRQTNQNRKEIVKQCLISSAKSLADIVRTPLYGTAVTVISVAALIIGPLAPKVLYDCRELIGKLIKSLNWNQRAFDLAPCFQSFWQLPQIDISSTKYIADTIYAPQATDYEIGLNNLARTQIRFRQGKSRLTLIDRLNPFIEKLDPSKRFVSPSYSDVLKIQQRKTS